MSRIIVELAAPLVDQLVQRALDRQPTGDSLARVADDLRLPTLAKVLDAFGKPHSETLFRERTLIRRCESRDGFHARSPVTLVSFYAITIDSVTHATARRLAEALRRLKGVVASASLETGYACAHLADAPPDYQRKQRYLSAAPDGLGVESLASGTDARGCGFATIDRGWNLAHEALAHLQVSPPVVYPRGSKIPVDRHGTAVLGIIVGRAKIRGMAQGASVKALVHDRSLVRPDSHQGFAPDTERSLAETVFELLDDTEPGANALKFGDVLLIEFETANTSRPTSDADDVRGLPLETQVPMFRAIQHAVSMGIVVIELAGNGNRRSKPWNLDDVATRPSLAPAWQPKSLRARVGGRISRWTHPASDVHDSGAIMVGACEPLLGKSGTGPYYPIRPNYNFGSRIDCYAWGTGVMTIGRNLPPYAPVLPVTGATDYYDSSFNGTSAAAALVAGVALLVQGIARERLGYPLSPRQLRSLLSDPRMGTPVRKGKDVVGIVPDLNKLQAKLGDLPKIGIRAFAGDDGEAPAARRAMTVAAQSPDILLSATKQLIPALDNIIRGQSSFVYIRLRNHGAAEVRDVRVMAYWAVHEDDSSANVAWHELGEGGVDRLASSSELVIADPIEWEIPADLETQSGKVDIIVAAGGDMDPRPYLPPVRDARQNGLSRDQLLPFLRSNSNVALRTFEVADFA